jgi:hypothetical protein
LERKKDHTGRDRDRKFNPLVLNEIQTAADILVATPVRRRSIESFKARRGHKNGDSRHGLEH